ncbi:MAG: hypothetical protein M0D55_02365 [Elusimicrobiota bacterium]|nr:MAG: hypothetical protein M0D55_02365 [Elusimicrobiota bacterium]
MSRGAVLALAAAAALGACDWLTGDFRLAGVVDIAPELAARAPKTNSVLFVVARNGGGVPLAVHRIVNPEFPASFEMSAQDLLVPGIRRNEPLTVVVRLNAHGILGEPRAGDLEGSGPPGGCRPGDRGVRVRLDKSL